MRFHRLQEGVLLVMRGSLGGQNMQEKPSTQSNLNMQIEREKWQTKHLVLVMCGQVLHRKQNSIVAEYILHRSGIEEYRHLRASS